MVKTVASWPKGSRFQPIEVKLFFSKVFKYDLLGIWIFIKVLVFVLGKNQCGTNKKYCWIQDLNLISIFIVILWSQVSTRKKKPGYVWRSSLRLKRGSESMHWIEFIWQSTALSNFPAVSEKVPKLASGDAWWSSFQPSGNRVYQNLLFW